MLSKRKGPSGSPGSNSLALARTSPFAVRSADAKMSPNHAGVMGRFAPVAVVSVASLANSIRVGSSATIRLHGR